MPRLLLVDDEPLYRETLSILLARRGFEVETAADGQEALDKARRFEPDVLVVDLMLRESINSREVIAGCKALQPDVQTIVMTGYLRETVEDKIRDCQPEEVLFKPFEIEELCAAIARALKRRRSPG